MVCGVYPMARMRRSTSATSASEAPDFSTMIMAAAPCRSRLLERKRPRAPCPRPGIAGAAGWSARGSPGKLGQSRWADPGEEIKEVEERLPVSAHERAGYSTGARHHLSRALVARALVAALAREAPQDALAIVVERQAGAGHEGDEH